MIEPKRAKPSDKFRDAVRKILSVPKTEIAKREAEYKKSRKATKRAGR